MRVVAAISAGLAHALLMLFAYPPVGIWPAALVAIVPLAWAAVRISEAAHVASREDGATAAAMSPRRRLAPTLRPALALGIGVFPFYIYHLHWLIPVTAVGYLPMAVGMALFASAFVWLIAEARLRLSRLPLALTVPIVWTGLEVFRGEVAFSGYPWFLIAHPLIDAPILPRPAAVLGTYFVSFLVAMLAGAAIDLLHARGFRPLLAAAAPRRGRDTRRTGFQGLAGLAFILLASLASLLAPGGREAPDVTPFRIAVVQTNLPQDNKIAWTIERKLLDFERFLELSAKAASAEPEPDLIIWPETMFPDRLDPQAVAEQRRVGLLYHVDPAVHPAGRVFATEFHDWLLELQHAAGVPMLIGAIGIDNLRIDTDEDGGIIYDADAAYNSVFLVANGRVNPERYDKLRLTPFGEFMPYINQWPWLERQLLALGARGMSFDLAPGGEPRTFEVVNADGQAVALATPICFEVTAPRLNHLLLRTVEPDRPRVLVNITNDGWFSTFHGGRAQHLQISRWRALENGVPMVRAANTGISAWIDARGRLVKVGTDDGALAHADGVMTADVRPTTGGTIYSRTGDLFAWSILAAAGGLILVTFARRRTTG